MKRTVKIDPFFANQPEKEFLKELTSPVHGEKPFFFGRRSVRVGEADGTGMYLAEKFEAEQDVLDVSYADFERFLKIHAIAGNRYPVRLKRGETDCFEAYRIEVSKEEAVVTANDTEGIRRALIYLEDEMLRREGPFLPVGLTERRPSMKARITRCFFSPINRPPKYGDELSDDIDYYPGEYLNRLMHDGANGVWIYTRFSDLVSVDALPSYGKGAQARIEKLNRVIKKCARYGVRVYVFAIEPVAMGDELAKLLPGADGGELYPGSHLFCVNSPEGRAAVEEAGRKLFEACPELGGFISITYGERSTSCSSAYASIPVIGYRQEMICPRCSRITPGQAVANAAAALAAGIHQASPDAQVISWTYGHRLWPVEDVRDYIRRAPEGVISMQNFEEMGYAQQLGRTRQGVDYWLSYAGPSPLFYETAKEAMKCGKEMYMKIQTCCSHEVASVPYVPVPGLLFDKYRSARSLGVTGVMQCWYFGNYPSLMSKAAGELAFMHDFSDKTAFLEHLAGIYWGESRAAQAAAAWERFEEAYAQYPLNIMFSYYGPMHDGPVWELQLKPKNFSLPRTWQTLDPTDGDRIGECLLSGHTLEEALELTGRMTEKWNEGVGLLRAAQAEGLCTEQISVAEALDILFASGHAILKFYALRERLGLGDGDAQALLERMRRIVLDEMDRSRKLSDLCRQDSRLGYHSEGEGFKFFPEKLAHRIGRLQRLLDDEFAEVENRIRSGKAPLAYYAAEETDGPVCAMHSGGIEGAEWVQIGKNAALRAAYDERNLTLEIRSAEKEWVDICPEFRLMWPAPPVRLHPDGRVEIQTETYLYYAVFGEELERQRRIWQTEVCSPEGGTVLRVTLDREEIGWTADRPLKLRLCTQSGQMWAEEENPVHTLGKTSVSPGEFGWLLPER